MAERTLEEQVKMLADQVKMLADIESIKQLKYRYWRFVHTGQPEKVAGCFSEDAEFTIRPSTPPFKGREQIQQIFEGMVKAGGLTVPQGHNPEIEIIGSNRAVGLWQLDNIRFEGDWSKGSRMGNGYVEEYVKENGQWLIRRSTVSYLFLQNAEPQDLSVMLGGLEK